MKRLRRFFLWIILSILPGLCGCALFTRKDPSPRLVRTIPLYSVLGPVQSMTLDAASGRLFATAKENRSVEVIDLKDGRILRSLPGIQDPVRTCLAPDLNRLFVASPADDACYVYDLLSFERLAVWRNLSLVAPIVYDAARRTLYLGYMAGLATVRAEDDKPMGDVVLVDRPYQAVSTASKVYLSIPSSDRVTVVDKEAMQTVDPISLGDARENYALALDEKGRRLFAGTEKPSGVWVLDLGTGQRGERLPTDTQIEQIFYDPKSKRLAVFCLGGSVTFFEERAKGRFEPGVKLPIERATAACFAPGNTFYVAVLSDRGTQINVYQL